MSPKGNDDIREGMENIEFLHKLAKEIASTFKHTPDGGTWDRWTVKVNDRFFTVYAILQFDYIPETGVQDEYGKEEFFFPELKSVQELEVYEDRYVGYLEEEDEWDVTGNSEKLKQLINEQI